MQVDLHAGRFRQFEAQRQLVTGRVGVYRQVGQSRNLVFNGRRYFVGLQFDDHHIVVARLYGSAVDVHFSCRVHTEPTAGFVDIILYRIPHDPILSVVGKEEAIGSQHESHQVLIARILRDAGHEQGAVFQKKNFRGILGSGLAEVGPVNSVIGEGQIQIAGIVHLDDQHVAGIPAGGYRTDQKEITVRPGGDLHEGFRVAAVEVEALATVAVEGVFGVSVFVKGHHTVFAVDQRQQVVALGEVMPVDVEKALV